MTKWLSRKVGWNDTSADWVYTVILRQKCIPDRFCNIMRATYFRLCRHMRVPWLQHRQFLTSLIVMRHICTVLVLTWKTDVSHIMHIYKIHIWYVLWLYWYSNDLMFLNCRNEPVLVKSFIIDHKYNVRKNKEL